MNRKGFTLVEMMIVIGTVLIVIGIGLMAIGSIAELQTRPAQKMMIIGGSRVSCSAQVLEKRRCLVCVGSSGTPTIDCSIPQDDGAR